MEVERRREYQRLYKAGLRGRDLVQALADWERERVSREGVLRADVVAREAWARWIAGLAAWRVFGTLTWPVSVGEERRRWQAREFLRRDVGGQWVLAWERHWDGRLHGHWIGDREVRRLETMDRWTERTGGFARVEAVRSVYHAGLYLAKYLLKEGGGAEMEFS